MSELPNINAYQQFEEATFHYDTEVAPILSIAISAKRIADSLNLADRARADAAEAREKALREALEPVMHWYQSDEHEERPLAEVVADVVADLQHDRAFFLAHPDRTDDAIGFECHICGIGHKCVCPTATDDALERAAKVAVARCIAIARETRDGFLSPEYATDQPLSSFSERFACDQVAGAIEQEFGMGTNEQRRLLGLPTPAEEYARTTKGQE